MQFRKVGRRMASLVLLGSIGIAGIQGGLQADASETPEVAFKDVTKSAGVLLGPTMSFGSTWVDHDSDGDPDVFANRHWKLPTLYLNEGSRYRPHWEDFGPTAGWSVFDRHACAWGEASGDGVVDLYCASGAQKGEGTGPNQLWIQSANGFVNQSKAYGTQDLKGRSRHVNWIDYDSDGDLDIFVANKQREGAPSLMYRNDRGAFTKVDAGLSSEMNAIGSTWSDWDNDGDPDILVTRYYPEKAVAYENLGGAFEQVVLPGITDRHWSSSAWGDFDGDGWTDLQLVGLRSTSIFRNAAGSFAPVHNEGLEQGASSTWIDVDNDGDLDSFVVQARRSGRNRPDFFLIAAPHGFTRVGAGTAQGPRAGSGEVASVADHDRDGLLDLFVSNGATVDAETDVEGSWFLYKNRSEAGNWAALELHGPSRNPWGFGARVEVTADGLTVRRQLNDGMSLRAQSEVGHLHLGLGDNASASVRVEWPDGTADCSVLEAGTTLDLSIGGHPCTPVIKGVRP